jgi:predicted anti-sigma-YlaC factor YlaD
MECKEIRDLLDAHALGAAEADEANAVDEHVGDCVRCWSSLNEAQRAAASIALSTVLQRAPDMKLERIR